MNEVAVARPGKVETIVVVCGADVVVAFSPLRRSQVGGTGRVATLVHAPVATYVRPFRVALVMVAPVLAYSLRLLEIVGPSGVPKTMANVTQVVRHSRVLD